MRRARSGSCRLASRQINWPARLIAQATQQILLKTAQAKLSLSVIKKGVLRKHPIRENNTCVCFHQGHNWKNELLLARAFFIRSVLS